MDDVDTRLSDHEQSHAPSHSDALDRLSLVQALRDFEVANGRVIDLTQRLVLTAEQLVSTRDELATVRAERDGLDVRLDDLGAQLEALRETHERTLQRKSLRFGDALYSAGRSALSRRRG